MKTIAECGINHNGSLEIAKQLIDWAKLSGFDYVKFQKREPDICVPDNKKKERKGLVSSWKYEKTSEKFLFISLRFFSPVSQ